MSERRHSENDEEQMKAFLSGLGGVGFEAAKRLGIGTLEAFGAGDVGVAFDIPNSWRRNAAHAACCASGRRKIG